MKEDQRGVSLGAPQDAGLKWLWREEATEAVLDFPESTRVGCTALAEAARLRVGGGKARRMPGARRGRRVGQARLRLCSSSCVCFSFSGGLKGRAFSFATFPLSHFYFSVVWRIRG